MFIGLNKKPRQNEKPYSHQQIFQNHKIHMFGYKDEPMENFI